MYVGMVNVVVLRLSAKRSFSSVMKLSVALSLAPVGTLPSVVVKTSGVSRSRRAVPVLWCWMWRRKASRASSRDLALPRMILLVPMRHLKSVTVHPVGRREV